MLAQFLSLMAGCNWFMVESLSCLSVLIRRRRNPNRLRLDLMWTEEKKQTKVCESVENPSLSNWFISGSD
uniref:Uncharacterized protein n=1 Tax=Nothobranchius furzeri TaxID=105023 RepID=A0A1A8B4V4_NOTFU